MKLLFDLRCQGQSIRGIAATLGISRNTVRKYLRAPEIPKPKPRPKRPSKLEPFVPYIQQRLSEGVDNCVVLLRELKGQGYTGGHSILKEAGEAPGRPLRQCTSQPGGDALAGI